MEFDDERELARCASGDAKIDGLGRLAGARQFRLRTFSILGRGDRLFMLSTEPARCMGYRDSYSLFQRHVRLRKVVLVDAEKRDLVARGLVPASYDNRTITAVSARAVFIEFGAKVVVGGRFGDDDYMAPQGPPGELASPHDRLPVDGEPYDTHQFVAWHGASAPYRTGAGVSRDSPAAELDHPAHTPVVQAARAAAEFNKGLAALRREWWAPGGREEPHTAANFMPAASQPSRAVFVQSSANGPLVVSQLLRRGNLVAHTGLAGVDPEVYRGVECVQAIEEQIRNERGAARLV